MEKVKALQPFGKALLEYFMGDTENTTWIIREDGVKAEVPSSVFFGDSGSFSAIENKALSLCRGRILDVGAGTGKHSLALQDQGLSVCAIDILPDAVKIMQSSGVKEVLCADILNFDDERFDTILMLGHGLGLSQNLKGLDLLLKRLRTLLSENGIILCDSLDVRITSDTGNLSYQKSIEEKGRYRGEVRFSFEYKGIKGPPVKWLHVDPDTLKNYASRNKYSCEIILMEDTGDYLASLRPVI
jgi:SAM-dependent methyltransferase